MLEPISISESITDGRRFYLREGNSVPSVTTILGATQKNGGYLLKWNLENPGAREKAADRGRAVHQSIEEFLLHGAEPVQADNEETHLFFSHAKPLLRNLTPLFIELPIFSHTHGFAGRVDCGAVLKVNGTDFPVLIDWKTSGKRKTNWYDYPLQLAAYLNGFRETYPDCGIDFSHTMIACVCPTELQVQLYEPPQIEFYWQKFQARLKQFHARELRA